MKSFLTRQRQEGFFSIRFKSSAGKLTAAQLMAIHGLAEKFGDGFITLTGRQEISIPFVRKEDFEAIKTFGAENGLQISPVGTIFKQVTACQGTRSCVAGIIDSPKIALELDNRHGGRELPCKITCSLTGLDLRDINADLVERNTTLEKQVQYYEQLRKITCSVTGCPNNCMKVEGNDIGIKGAIEPQFIAENCIYCGACQKICPVAAIFVGRNQKIWTIDRDKCINCGRCIKVCRKAALRGEVGFKIYFAGKNFLPMIRDEETLYKIIDAALKYFEENAKPRERFGKLLERLGTENFLAALK